LKDFRVVNGSFKINPMQIRQTAISRDARTVLACNEEGAIYRWDAGAVGGKNVFFCVLVARRTRWSSTDEVQGQMGCSHPINSKQDGVIHRWGAGRNRMLALTINNKHDRPSTDGVQGGMWCRLWGAQVGCYSMRTCLCHARYTQIKRKQKKTYARSEHVFADLLSHTFFFLADLSCFVTLCKTMGRVFIDATLLKKLHPSSCCCCVYCVCAHLKLLCVCAHLRQLCLLCMCTLEAAVCMCTLEAAVSIVYVYTWSCVHTALHCAVVPTPSCSW
jgi:hypothetical protein